MVVSGLCIDLCLEPPHAMLMKTLNQTMKYFLSFLLLGSLLSPFIAKADVAPDRGSHPYISIAVIDNLANFEDFDVYTSYLYRFGPAPTLAQGPEAIPTLVKDADNHHGFGGPFYAVRKVDQSKIIHQDDPGKEQGDIWYQLTDNQRYILQATEDGTPSDFSSELVGGGVPDSNPVVGFVSTYHIVRLDDDSNFDVRLVGESRYDKNGKLLSNVAISNDQKQNTTVSESMTLGLSTSTLVTGVLVGLGILGLIIGIKAWKMK